MIWKKIPMGRVAVLPLAAAVLILAGFLGFWKVRYDAGHEAQGQARDELWAVPAKYDEEEPKQAGTVEEIVYDTKAYATDERIVKKTAYVYLPYGYSKDKQYNILYLMHGTGDDEKYWLKTNPYNKTMLDNMIADGDIEPLIVVTPTFYVEDDCADDLDQLTYSFAKELRNDLMPEIESSYSTYAKSADDKGIRREPGSQSLLPVFVKRGGNDVSFCIVPEPGLFFLVRGIQRKQDRQDCI